jgi:hypothetical protein
MAETSEMKTDGCIPSGKPAGCHGLRQGACPVRCRLVGRRYSGAVSAFSTSGVGQAPVQEIAGSSCG